MKSYKIDSAEKVKTFIGKAKRDPRVIKFVTVAINGYVS